LGIVLAWSAAAWAAADPFSHRNLARVRPHRANGRDAPLDGMPNGVTVRIDPPRASTVVLAAVALFGATLATAEPGRGADPVRELRVDLRAFKVIERDSGPVNYYTFVSGSPPYIHAAYRPPYDTTVLGYAVPEAMRAKVATVRWKWRAVALPRGGNECADGPTDSAAVVYVTWRRTLRWYSVKYVWSSVGPKGATCDRKRNPFRAQDTVIVESGPPLGEWRTVVISPDVEYRNHFEGGDASASVPDFIGVGIMSDGDQTQSPSEADYADFVIEPRP
jgi:hypothetical protein